MLFTLLLLFANLLFVTFTGLKNLGEKNPVIDLYIAESKGFTSGRPSVFFCIYPLFQWRITYKPDLVSPFE